ncbi:MAG TPA: PKD domain-containing protein [Pilimelia sp.]|nr:PKD domain-containing protein [Pilimelia sp.]
MVRKEWIGATGRWRVAGRHAVAGAAVAGALVLGVAAAVTAVPVTPSTARTGSLTEVGPVAEHGFPSWYRDSNGLRLEACLTLDDPLCPALADEIPNSDAPVSFPENFPGEFFYQLAGAEMTLSTGAEFAIGMDLEGAWAAEEVRAGDQMVFGRVRIRFDAPQGEKYRITHPYGVDEITADDRGVNMTEDIGTVPGAFGVAMTSRIGPFLRWDPAIAPAAPAGYTGDPGVDHRVVGSPYATNFVRVERIDAGGAVLAQLGRTDLFSVQGRLATNGGLEVDQATYTVGENGSGVIEVYARSEPGQAIALRADPALGLHDTPLRADRGRYYGRFPVTGPLPEGAGVTVVNAGDNPVAVRARKLTDVVTVARAAYDADAQKLTVDAASSDRDATAPTLSVTGFGPLTAGGFSGVAAPPATVTVTSSAGGSTTVPVVGSGEAFRPQAPVAAAVAPTSAAVGAGVVLDGSASRGEISDYTWRQTDGPAVALTGADAAKASFVPTTAGAYTFTLTVTGPGGASTPVPVTIVVSQTAARPTADAGADQTVRRGLGVTLDGATGGHVSTVTWRQVSGPAVTLSGADTARPTFTMPTVPVPAAPGPNPAYQPDTGPLVFALTATGPAGSATDQVRVTAQPETLSGITARWRTRGEWRIGGTSNLAAGQRVAVVLGGTPTGRVIGQATVGADRTFSIRAATPAPGTVRTVTVVSSMGGRATATVTVTS